MKKIKNKQLDLPEGKYSDLPINDDNYFPLPESYEGLTELQEDIRFKLIDMGFQLGELHSELDGWARIHAPGCIETYEDTGCAPIFFYGSIESMMKTYGLKKVK